jgi:hypothetical protein
MTNINELCSGMWRSVARNNFDFLTIKISDELNTSWPLENVRASYLIITAESLKFM